MTDDRAPYDPEPATEWDAALQAEEREVRPSPQRIRRFHRGAERIEVRYNDDGEPVEQQQMEEVYVA